MVDTQKVADFITQNFSNCPLCGQKSGFSNYKKGFDDYAECKSCGAKWHLLFRSKEMILKRTSNDFTGDYLLGIKRPVTFWETYDPNKIEWSETIKPTLSLRRSLFLEKGETILASWNGSKFAKRLVPSLLGELEADYVSSNGVLVLTNQKLLWLENYKRVVGITSLENITQLVQKHHKDREGVDITDSKGNAYFYHLIRMSKYPSCRPLIEKAIQERKEEIKTQRLKERTHVVLDFSFLRDYMKKGGLILKTFRCPHCNAPFELPNSGNQAECKHCENTIYVQDIFEKVKALLG